jgi:hypothetical protein
MVIGKKETLSHLKQLAVTDRIEFNFTFPRGNLIPFSSGWRLSLRMHRSDAATEPSNLPDPE